MNCQRCREQLQEYLDGTLEADEQALVSVHVASCEACRRELDELRKLAALVGSLDEVPEPAGFLQAVRERIDRPTVWERLTGVLSRPLRPGVSVAIPVIIVAFIGVFIVMTNLPKTTEPAEEDEAAERTEIARTIDSPDATPGEPGVDRLYYEKQRPDREAGSRVELGDTDTLESSVGRGPTGDGQPSKRGREEHGETELAENLKVTGRLMRNGTVEAAEGAEPEKTSAGEDVTMAFAGGSEKGAADTAKAAEDEKDLGGQRQEVIEAGTIHTATTTGDEAAGREAGPEGSTVTQDEEQSVVDLAEAETKQEEEAGTSFFGFTDAAFGAQPEGTTVIPLVVRDLPADLTNVQKIVKEEGGYAKEVRDEDASLKLLNLYVPAASYDNTVKRLSLYNEQNKQELDRKKRGRGEDTEENGTEKSVGASVSQKALKTLTLIVQRIVEQAPADESE